MNDIVHKDYGSGVPIQISVYDDKIVFWNPGELPEKWTVERLLRKHPSKPFNPLLANAFFRAGYIESWGRGIEKINRECREHDIEPPTYDIGMSGLMVTFQANPAHLAAEPPAKTPGKTPERIMGVLSAHPDWTLAQVAQAIGKSQSAVERSVRKLSKSSQLRHIGPRKAGHWEVLK